MNVLGIGGSSRKNGNTDLLLKETLLGFKDSGAKCKKIFIRDFNILFCLACEGCYKKGICIIKDDMQKIYCDFKWADCIVLVSPIYFYGLPARIKNMIDRCQCLWEKKHIFKENINKIGIHISVGGTNGKRLFDGSVLTVKYFFNSIGVKYCDSLFIRGIDKVGDNKKNSKHLNKVYELGKNLKRKGD